MPRTMLRYAIEQVTDYALDLNCFHKESHDKLLVPILICTNAPEKEQTIQLMQENILEPYCCNDRNIATYITKVCSLYTRKSFDYQAWINSIYMPTPTIIEAAQSLYRGHNVEEISRNDASAKNLKQTTDAINKIIDFSKKHNRKSICFITGVPGAGKTLAGLNIAIERQKIDENEHAVFLSGNGPLVDVLQEALARDDAISVTTAPIERVAAFDEAQRAWDKANLSDFMRRKKGVFDFNMSEPEFLISIMNRHIGWAVIICLVGGGQEINKGESAGISGWFQAISEMYPDWDVYISDKITEQEYTKGESLHKMTKGVHYQVVSDLHLAVSLRSFRSEKMSDFVKALLDANVTKASSLYNQIHKDYPIYLTRNLETAKEWVKSKAKGSQRYGMIASSGAKRLRQYGIWVQNKIDAPTWFLNDRQDVRSSYFLEETATEFDIQGLELDWTIVC